MMFRVYVEAKGYSAKGYNVVALNAESAQKFAILMFRQDHKERFVLGQPYILDCRPTR